MCGGPPIVVTMYGAMRRHQRVDGVTSLLLRTKRPGSKSLSVTIIRCIATSIMRARATRIIFGFLSLWSSVIPARYADNASSESCRMRVAASTKTGSGTVYFCFTWSNHLKFSGRSFDAHCVSTGFPFFQIRKSSKIWENLFSYRNSVDN